MAVAVACLGTYQMVGTEGKLNDRGMVCCKGCSHREPFGHKVACVAAIRACILRTFKACMGAVSPERAPQLHSKDE